MNITDNTQPAAVRSELHQSSILSAWLQILLQQYRVWFIINDNLWVQWTSNFISSPLYVSVFPPSIIIFLMTSSLWGWKWRTSSSSPPLLLFSSSSPRIKYSPFRSFYLINYWIRGRYVSCKQIQCKYAYQFYSWSLRAPRFISLSFVSL